MHIVAERCELLWNKFQCEVWEHSNEEASPLMNDFIIIDIEMMKYSVLIVEYTNKSLNCKSGDK